MPESQPTGDNGSAADEPPLQNVLVPIDGSGALLDRFDTVAPLLAWSDPTIHVLHVISPGAATQDQGDNGARTDAKRLVQDTTDRLADRGFAVESHLAEGMPEDQIVHTADDLDVDLIVMVTRGGGLLNPSVTRMVIQAVDVPVMALGL